MKLFILIMPFFVSALFSHAQAQSNEVLLLWPQRAPGATGDTDRDKPTLTVFPPDPAKATGAALVICPGGGYEHLADHEGAVYAQWLTNQGIAGFVLKYRLGSAGYRHPIELQDAARAVRLVRANATQWKIDTNRIGIIGSSAGGHLASTLMTHFDAGKPDAADPIDRLSSRPDIGILVYPVVTMKPPFVHRGSRDQLLGRDASPELIDLLSNELQVAKETPPCFIFHGANDQTVPVENSLHFAEAMHKAGVPCELHVYEKAAHGIGLGTRQYEPEKFHPWAKQCELWLKAQKFAN
jgi:acetyl esterase/lipase